MKSERLKRLFGGFVAMAVVGLVGAPSAPVTAAMDDSTGIANATGGARDTMPDWSTNAIGLLGAFPAHHDPVPCYGSGNANSRYTGQTNYNYIVENAYRGNSRPACNALPSCSFMDSQSTSAFYASLGFAALAIFTAPAIPLSIAAAVGATVLGIYSYRAANTPCGI